MESANFKWLIFALLVFLVGVPLADDFGATGSPLARVLLFSCMLGIGVLSLRGAGKVFVMAMTMAVLGILLSIAAAQTNSTAAVYISFLAIFLFLVIMIAFTFRRVATDRHIDLNRIAGAIAVYLMLGVLWAVTYTLVELSFPGSFRGIDTTDGTYWTSDWLYFSYVTMTTLGYGDIAPASAIARLLAYMQAIVGQLYIAILIAGLVGAYIARRD